MISMQHISGAGVGDAARYHDKSFSQNAGQKADNYYVNEKASARWEGRGAEILGIQGKEVEREAFIDLLNGKLFNPATGEVQDLAENSKGEDRRAGMDFTISPAKSVSIAGLVGKDERIVDAHLAANQRAMEWLEKHGAIVRVKDENGRNRSVGKQNLVYATVMHETNRENEPQIHSHNVIVSAVYDETDQKWRSLTNDQMLKLRAKADVIYKAELAQGLKRAGYELEYADNGVDFEIKGFSPEHIELYATRKNQIKAALLARGIEPGSASFDARQTAALDSRSRKQELPRDALQQIWQDAGRDAGLSVASIVSRARERAKGVEQAVQTRERADRLPGNAGARQVDAVAQKAAVRAVSWAVEHLSEREQAFSLVDVELAAVKFSRGGIDDVDWAIQQHIKNHLLVARGTDTDGAMMYTTHRAIETEMRLSEHIRAGMGENRVVLTGQAEFDAAVQTFEARKGAELGAPFKLSGEQLEAARNLLMHPDSFQGVQGDAGTGKTAALEMVNDVAKARGWRVSGVATSAAAAKQLEGDSGIESDTVAGYLSKRDNRIKATELRLAELRSAMTSHAALRKTASARLETHRLAVAAEDVRFGTHRYTFDHQRGEVFRSRDSFVTTIGVVLTDVANRHHDAAAAARETATTLGERLRARAYGLAVSASDSLGRRMASYEQVGTVEAVAARTTLYLTQSEKTDLQREIAVKEAELANLRRWGNAEGQRTLLVMDESSLTGAADTEKIASLARQIGARVVLQGDVRQHGSVASGRAFEQAQDAGMHVSYLQETRRFVDATPQTKQALLDMKAGEYAKAIGRLDTLEVDNLDLASTVATRYLTNLEELRARGVDNPRVGVVAITNADRKKINAAIHRQLAEHGEISSASFIKPHLDDPKMTKAEQTQAVMLRQHGVDTLVFRKSYREIGVAKGDVLQVVGYDVPANRILATNARGKRIEINPQRQDLFSPAKREERAYAVGDRVEARAILHLQGPDKEPVRIANGTAGVITAIDEHGAKVQWSRVKHASDLKNDDLRYVDHAYAHTSYKEQGATNHREIVAVSVVGAKVFNRLAAYVAASRAKDNTEVVTADRETMLQNAGAEVKKTTAVDMKEERKRAQTKDVAQRQEAVQTLQPARAGAEKGREAAKVRDHGQLLEW
ncbi:MobF family relaxase [Ralstonia pseudosolanacearum]|jgi:conjugative relaxase-like TrwC/TraI family protein|nr:MobF family relaxase [Ralstonia pseudosolanacearum]